MADLGTPYLYWVCSECESAQAGIAEDERAEPYPDNVLSLIPEDATVTEGMLWEEHADDCPNREAGEWVAECGCESREFVKASCEGCGSPFDGSRHALTVWIHEETA